ncbi:MAG: aminomethyl transferase family protein [Actinobacteria bacterium]|nr:aminomethyl transferase family protein [Actinomycetota bacterium]
MSVGTAFHPRTSTMNEKLAWGEWSGYHAAAVYADFHDIEYNAIREAAAVIDVSPLYKYVVSGPDAPRLMNRVLPRDAVRQRVNQVLYTPWVDEDGRMIDDGTVTRLTENSYRVTAALPCYRWFLMNATGLDVQVDDITETTAGLALQGQKSRAVLEAASGQDWSDVPYFGRRASSIGGVPVDVTRTGYTGDLGYELWVSTDDALAMWDRLFEVGPDFRLRPAGINALDVSRVEAGLILIDAEFTSSLHARTADHFYSPAELGLGRLIDFDKGDFVGRRALLAERERGGPPRRLVGLDLDWAGIESMFARHGLAPEVSAMVHRPAVPIYREGRQVGRATSICWGPTIKRMVGFGSVDRRHEPVGTRLSVEWSVEGERGKVPATVVPLPFLDLPRKRA